MEDLEDLYENAPCGYLSLGADGSIIKLNQTLCGWLDAKSYDLLGKRFYDLLNVPGKIFYETHFAPLLRMQGYFNEVALDIVGPTGRKLPVLVNAVEKRSRDGAVIFTRVTLFQAAERRRYERELVDARRLADRAREELQTLNEVLERRVREAVEEHLRLRQGLLLEREVARVREQFVAILGHDLRNPLAAITGGLNILCKEPQTDKAKKVLSLMDRSAERMFGLINDMLDFARLKSGAGIDVTTEPTDLAPVLEQVIEELRTSNPDRLIESDGRLPPLVVCDAPRVSQVVSNLLGNALTHGKEDEPVRLEAVASPDEVTIAVTNRGDQIPDDVQSRLFQPFFRAGASSGKKGLGLGLYIASEIAKSHGGRLEVVSSPEETCFMLKLPVRGVEAQT